MTEPLIKKILCVWLPNWPIQRLVAADDTLRKTQIVLYRNQPGRGQIVTAVSPAAEVSGARIGMPLSEAKSLVGRSRKFAGHHVLEHNPSADLRTLQQLAMDCQQFSPIVGLEEPETREPRAILMDASGLTHLFGGQDGLRNHIHQYFQSLGYLISTAVAPTIGQAWALARFACLNDDDSFESLPIQALRLQETTVDTLAQLGITKVFQIRSLPRAGLRSRFGDELTRRLDQADGQINEVISAIYPPVDYQVEKFLDYPVSDHNSIEVLVSQLAGQLCQQMKSSGRGGLVWQFDLHGPLEQDTPEKRDHHFNVKLFQPTASLKQLMPLVKMQMESLFRGRGPRKSSKGRKKGPRRKNRLAFQVQEVVVSVRNCVLLAERQRQLFDENPRLDKQALAHLINRLSSRLGTEHVLRPVLQSGAQAEDTCYFEPLVGQTRKKPRRAARHRNTVSPLQRPLTLYPRPLPIAAVSLDGTPHRSSNIPDMFLHENQRLHVKRRWGPERIETAWWRGPTIRRDYWRIETVENRWLWIFRDLQKHSWNLHGEF